VNKTEEICATENKRLRRSIQDGRVFLLGLSAVGPYFTFREDRAAGRKESNSFRPDLKQC